MDQQVDVVVFAVELAKFGLEVGADLAHEFLAADQHRVGEHPTPVLRHEHQMYVEVVDNMATSAYIGVWIPSR
ncbi:hypothetical protein GCM10023075_66830 [Streptosporangium album]